MEQEKSIGNINILDLRNATEDSVAGIKRIGNANLVIYTRKTAHLLTHLSIGNVNATVELPLDVDVRILMGSTVINREYFRNQNDPAYLLVMGKIVFEPDIPIKEIATGLAGFVMMGELICPENLIGAVQSKAKQVMGRTVVYPAFTRVKIGSLVLEKHYLDALEDGSELAVIGALRAPHDISSELLERKVAKLFVSGTILCHAENAQAIQTRLVDGSGKVAVVPAGFRLVPEPLVLDNTLLESLPATRLYCTAPVLVETSVASALLDERLEKIISRDLLICPAPLRSVLTQKCDLLETQVVFYEGDLWLMDGEHHLWASRFDHLTGKATVLVTGELTIDSKISPAVLTARLAKVHNRGVISCTPDQMGAIESLLGLRDGELVDSTRVDEESKDWIGNVNCLTL